MSLEATYTNEAGDVKNINSGEMAEHLKEAGYNVTMSPDGNTFYQNVNGQEMEGSFKDMLEAKYGKVSNIKPLNSDESNVSPYLRLKLESLPNDNETRKAFLRSHLANQEGQDVGMDQISGSGSDWYYFNPKTGKHYSLTNKEGMDFSDISGLVPSVSRGIASGASGILSAGAGAGLASIPLGAAGAVAGGKVASKIGQSILGYADEDFNKALGDYNAKTSFADKLGEDAGNMAGDAFGGALGPTIKGIQKLGPVAKELGGLAGKVTNASPFSQVAKGAGGIIEPAGSLVNQAGGYVANSPRFKQALTSFATGGKLDMMQIAKLPVAIKNFLKPGAAKAAEYLGEEGLAESLKSPAVPFIKKNVGIGEKIGRALGNVGKSQESTVYNNVRPDEVTNFYSKLYENGANAAKKAKEFIAPDMRAGYGSAGPKTSRMMAEEAKSALRTNAQAHKFGKTLGNTAAIGEAAEGAALAGAQGIARATQGVGATAKGLGYGLRQTGEALAPVEGRVLQKKAFDYATQNNNDGTFVRDLLNDIKMSVQKRKRTSQFDQ